MTLRSICNHSLSGQEKWCAVLDGRIVAGCKLLKSVLILALLHLFSSFFFISLDDSYCNNL